jgi:hypothetical protein
MFMCPDLTKTLRVFFGTSAPEIAYRYGFEVDMNRVITRIELVTPAIPLAPVRSVTLAASRSFTEHTESRVLIH